MDAARDRGDRAQAWRLLRDRAMVLLGFWRGFRGDELIRVQVEHLHLVPGEGMTCFVPRSKGDRNAQGMTYKIPALSRLCPVTATWGWVGAARLAEGPLFRRVDRWGHVAEQPLHPNSLISMLRRLLNHAGLANAADYSSHSLRRGFAGWANANGWDVKALMEYVGWRDVHSAMRYLDGSDPFARQRIEAALASSVPAAPPALLPQKAPDMPTLELELELRCVLTPFTAKGRGVHKARRHTEDICLAPWRAQRLDADSCRYRLVTAETGEALDEAIATLLDDMHRIADNHQCFLETSLCDLEGGTGTSSMHRLTTPFHSA